MRNTRRNHETGMALVLALLALMLLTFLGLTLAATTSTELQIANNYRWSQQAFYNAEAGIEIAKSVLGTVDWTQVVPAARNAPIAPWFGFSGSDGDGTTLTPAGTVVAGNRDYEAWECDWRGHGMGYGVVLNDGARDYQDVSVWPLPAVATTRTLNGAFTVWVRRPVVAGADTGKYSDTFDNQDIVITAEGVAPYRNPAALANVNAQRNQAVRMIEVAVRREAQSTACDPRGNPEGGGFSTCNPLPDPEP